MEIQITLKEQAYFNNSAGGGWQDNAYVARAEINGFPGYVWWLVTNPDSEDESNACDWNKPYLIELDTDSIDPDEHEIEICF